MKRNVIRIDEASCTGCGLCIPNCPEGAIQMIDGKARLISDLFCDGLGACLGHCPEGAIRIEEREAEPYDEAKVMENIVRQGANTVRAHLAHLRDHGATEWYRQALDYLEKHHIANPLEVKEAAHSDGGAQAAVPPPSGCPGARAMQLRTSGSASAASGTEPRNGSVSDSPPGSELGNWPVQLHLASPLAPYFKGVDVLLAADCTAFAMGDFHARLLKGKRLIIACPKLDQGQQVYEDKLAALIDDAGINTLTVAIMTVPCCGGLLAVAKRALARAQRKVPLKCIVVGLNGAIESEEWL